ncbi:MAG: NupC/NupG family nucleoside CNT transporter [Planctomycetes bacterium]|nr:NupC/NupG family nucleoside CNT transporter [Planctomycetota bacterium]
MSEYRGILGILLVLVAATLLSTNRAKVQWRLVAAVLVMLFLAKILSPYMGMAHVASAVNGLISFSDSGIRLVFGGLSNESGDWGFIFAVKVLPVIIYFSAVMAVLYHLGAMQLIIRLVSSAMRFAFRSAISGPEAVVAASNVFIGHTEAPLTVKPYISKMTESQLMALMTCGFATISCTVLVVYAEFVGGSGDREAQARYTQHLLTANLMSALGALMIARVMVPEAEVSEVEVSEMHVEPKTSNLIDAAATGASNGIRLAVNIGAMLVAFAALLAMADFLLAQVGAIFGVAWSLEALFAWALGPVAWAMGMEWEFGALLGKSIFATEFLAYIDLRDTLASHPNYYSETTRVIGAYALCSFANIPSVAVQIGGLTAIAPERRADFARVGFKAMLAGVLASYLTASIAGICWRFTGN